MAAQIFQIYDFSQIAVTEMQQEKVKKIIDQAIKITLVEIASSEKFCTTDCAQENVKGLYFLSVSVIQHIFRRSINHNNRKTTVSTVSDCHKRHVQLSELYFLFYLSIYYDKFYLCVSEERRPTVNELSNQRSIMQKVNGWKLYFSASQLEELV